MKEAIFNLLEQIYGQETGRAASARLHELLLDYSARIEAPQDYEEKKDAGAALPLDETDAVMITYGDQFHGPERTPLRYLHQFLTEELEGEISGVHILPFSPYSSDDGFSVIDYRKVNADLGSWADIQAISASFKLMADLVLNHCSAQSDWFRSFLAGKAPYDRYFITVPPGTDVSGVFRPRALPLLTPFDTKEGEKLVWTTFSADQVDLNYADPVVLLEMLDVLLFYVENGARLIRLDAIAYLWKELGTPCIHHRKTHLVVQLMRAVLEEIAPWVVIITETNVPHEENVSYFGDGNNEAHMVYNFSLPPLVLDACIRGDSSHLQAWGANLQPEEESIAFFNFLASHDGIGLLPARGFLSQEEINHLIEVVKSRGGLISYKATSDGDLPYEMNINYLSAVTDPALPDEQRARQFLASQSIMLCLAGVPGVYVHSLIGSENWEEGVEHTGVNRAINRRKLSFEETVTELETSGSLRNLVFEGFKRMLAARTEEAAFHPAAPQRILQTPSSVFGLMRDGSANSGNRVVCLVNLTADPVECAVEGTLLGQGSERSLVELISRDSVFPHWEPDGGFSVELEPHEIMWLRYRQE